MQHHYGGILIKTSNNPIIDSFNSNLQLLWRIIFLQQCDDQTDSFKEHSRCQDFYLQSSIIRSNFRGLTLIIWIRFDTKVFLFLMHFIFQNWAMDWKQFKSSLYHYVFLILLPYVLWSKSWFWYKYAYYSHYCVTCAFICIIHS